VAELAGEALGWDEDRRREEVEEVREGIAADRRAEAQAGDAAALAARRRRGTAGPTMV
jgi:hypothetical protein